MTDHPSAEDIAEQMQAEAIEAAMTTVKLLAVEHELDLDETRLLIAEIGVQAGYLETLQMLIRRGLLPGDPDADPS